MYFDSGVVQPDSSIHSSDAVKSATDVILLGTHKKTDNGEISMRY